MDNPHAVYWAIAVFNLLAIATVTSSRFVKLPDVGPTQNSGAKPAE